jgi:hypothetical protein
MSKELIEQLAIEYLSVDEHGLYYEGGLTHLEAFAKAYQAASPIDNVAEALEKAARIVEYHQIPVGNSAAGELACQWTYEALKEIAEKIRALIPDTQAKKGE